MGLIYFNFSKLNGRIVEKGLNAGKCSKHLKINAATFSKKMSNKNQFTAKEIYELVLLLDIPRDEIGAYFFTQ